MKSAITVFLTISLVAAVSCFVLAMGRKPGSPSTIPKFSAWVAYWDGMRARQALFVSAARLEEVDLFAYHFSENGNLVPADESFADLMRAFKQLPNPKPRLAITLVNDMEHSRNIDLKDPGCVHNAIATPEARDAHIQQILAIAQNADSIDVDYERVNAEDGPVFTAFIQALAQALHQHDKRLSVVVEPRVSDQRTSDPLSDASYALSWRDIGQAADQVTVMAYLYHYGGSGPGSIAPIDWVGKIADYSLQQVPKEKLSIALHLGGYDWPKSGPGKSLDYDKAEALASAYGAKIKLDSKTQSGHFSYTDGSGNHEVWIETAAGLEAKSKALAEAGISHIALWRLGAGDPTFWDSLKKN